MSELLFDGYEDKLINETAFIGKYPYDKFAFMYGRNGTSTDGRYTIKTGTDNLAKIGMMTAWNNKTKIDGYKGECSKFDGATAGELFAPMRGSQPIDLYIGDVCRPIELNYVPQKSDSTYLTYAADASTYNTSDTCYCNESPCPPSGVANISSCTMGSPVFLSLPHFLYGDEKLVDQFIGLNPDENKHGFYFKLDDKLGVPVSINVGVQLNVAVVKNPRLPFLSFLNYTNETVTYLPSLYFISSAEVPGNMKRGIDFLHFTLPVLMAVIPAVLAVVFFIFAALTIARIMKRHNQMDELLHSLIIDRQNSHIN